MNVRWTQGKSNQKALRDLTPACLSSSSCHSAHCTSGSRKTVSPAPSKCPLGLCVFAPVSPFARLSPWRMPHHGSGPSSEAASSPVKLSLIPSVDAHFSLFAALCKCLRGSAVLYCVVMFLFFARLFLLWDCKHRGSRDRICSSRCHQSLAQCLAPNSLSINICWLKLWMSKESCSWRSVARCVYYQGQEMPLVAPRVFFFVLERRSRKNYVISLSIRLLVWILKISWII